MAKAQAIVTIDEHGQVHVACSAPGCGYQEDVSMDIKADLTDFLFAHVQYQHVRSAEYRKHVAAMFPGSQNS